MAVNIDCFVQWHSHGECPLNSMGNLYAGLIMGTHIEPGDFSSFSERHS